MHARGGAGECADQHSSAPQPAHARCEQGVGGHESMTEDAMSVCADGDGAAESPRVCERSACERAETARAPVCDASADEHVCAARDRVAATARGQHEDDTSVPDDGDGAAASLRMCGRSMCERAETARGPACDASADERVCATRDRASRSAHRRPRGCDGRPEACGGSNASATRSL